MWLLGNIGKLPQCLIAVRGRGSAVRMASCPTYRINSIPPPPPFEEWGIYAWNCFAHSKWRGQNPPHSWPQLSMEASTPFNMRRISTIVFFPSPALEHSPTALTLIMSMRQRPLPERTVWKTKPHRTIFILITFSQLDPPELTIISSLVRIMSKNLMPVTNLVSF